MPQLQQIKLTLGEVNRLLEYSHSLPTGKTIGKRWKRREGDIWILGTYVECSEPNLIGIKWEEIIISDDKPEKQCPACHNFLSEITVYDGKIPCSVCSPPNAAIPRQPPLP